MSYIRIIIINMHMKYVTNVMYSDNWNHLYLKYTHTNTIPISV